jgi:hypothetical protein
MPGFGKIRWYVRWPLFKLSARAKKILLRAGVCLVILYLAFSTLVLWAMHQPPEKFAKVMSKMPGPVPFLLFPFETAWLRARAGHLNIGDPAPDFSLSKIDKSDKVQLSALNQQQPVVLVFGSYT